jgi:hypothetical protein
MDRAVHRRTWRNTNGRANHFPEICEIANRRASRPAAPIPRGPLLRRRRARRSWAARRIAGSAAPRLRPAVRGRPAAITASFLAQLDPRAGAGIGWMIFRPGPSRSATSARATSSRTSAFRCSFVVDDALEQTLGLELALGFLLRRSADRGLPVSWAHHARRRVLLNGFAPFCTASTARADREEGGAAWARQTEARSSSARQNVARVPRNEAAHRARMTSWRTLFLLASHREVGMCWWDAGAPVPIRSDLQARR